MPSFSPASNAHLDTCSQDIQRLFRTVVKTYDCSIWEGHRGKALQNKYYSESPQKSRVQWPNGKHNDMPSNAVHAAPYPFPGWEKEKEIEVIRACYHFAGYVRRVAEELGIKIRWGGNWDRDTVMNDQTWMDLIHYELVED